MGNIFDLGVPGFFTKSSEERTVADQANPVNARNERDYMEKYKSEYLLYQGIVHGFHASCVEESLITGTQYIN